MSERNRKTRNPFYVLLLVASTAFVATALGYLIGPMVQQQAREHPQAGPGPGSLALAAWLERRAPTVLAVEIGLMLAAGLLAMATDRWFSTRHSHGSGSRRE